MMGKKSKQKQQRKQSGAPVKQSAAPRQDSGVLAAAGTISSDRQTGHHRVAISTDYSYVRSDIRRISLLLLVMASILIASVIVNVRSPWLKKGGHAIAHFLDLQ